MPAPVNERNLTILGVLGSIAALAVGLFIFYSQWTYSEAGHDYLAIGYVLGCAILYFAIRLWNVMLLALALVFMLGTQIYAQEKFQWREDYIEMARGGQPFFLEEYIDHYPTYEEYRFAKKLNAPDWVRFNDECIQPALAAHPAPPRCASADLIFRHYNIDILETMKLFTGKMQNTAKMVQEGKLKKRSDYAECVYNKSCVTIPLLPKGVDAEKIDPMSTDYIGVRQSFWSLVSDKTMSQETCALTPVCRALVNLKVYEPGKLPF